MLHKDKIIKNKKIILVLAGILLIQFLIMFYFAENKFGFFHDEILTYELANYENTFLYNNVIDTWLPGSYFKESIIANSDNKFNFVIPYHNQENDVHPPLYYFVIHFISSLFPGLLSKWIGIAPNIIFCLLTSIVLFLITRKISDNNYLGLIVAAAWAFSVGAMTTMVYIRMYAMLTFECVLFVWLHQKLLDNILIDKIKIQSFLGLFFTTIAGILTQYYFIIFAFFLCGLFFLFLAYMRKWRVLISYTINEILAIISAIILFPKMLYHIFGGYRGVEAFQNFSYDNVYIEHLKNVLSIINHQCFNASFKNIFIIILFLLILYFVFKYLLECHLEKSDFGWSVVIKTNLHNQTMFFLSVKNIMLLIVGLSSIFYILFIAKIAPFQVDRYYMCIYPFIFLLFVNGLYSVISLFLKKKKQIFFCSVLVILFLTLLSYKMQSVNYLYSSYENRQQQLNLYNNYPVVILNGASYDGWLDMYLFEYKNNEAVYQCRHEDFSGLAKAAETYNLSNGFLLYAGALNNMSEAELFDEVNKYINVSSYQLVTSIDCPVYFCRLDTVLTEQGSDYSFNFDKNPFITDGVDIDGVRYLYQNGISYGPYIKLTSGNYTVDCRGTNLDKLTFDSVYKQNSELVWLNMLNVQQDTEHISYEIVISDEINNYEARFFNNTNLDVIINSIIITKNN